MSPRTGFGRGLLASILGILALVLAGVTFVLATVATDALGSFGGGIIAWLVGLYVVAFVIGAVGSIGRSGVNWFERKAKDRTQLRAQSERDRRAGEIVERLLRGEEPNQTFVLYLRPFFLTGALRITGMTDALTPWNEGDVLDLETLVAKSAQSLGPIVALGDPGEQLGFGRVKVPESSWRTVFGALASRARLIVVIPADRPGTEWEIRWLKENEKLDTCVFLMPPEVEKVEVPQQWSQAIAALEALGIELPPYHARGLLFTLDGSGKVADSWPLHPRRLDLRGALQS